jgi:hypothetical protein
MLVARHVMPSYPISSLCVVRRRMLDEIYVDSGRYRGLVGLCGCMRWPAGLLYAPTRGDVQPDGGPREGHTALEDAPPRNRPLIG